MQDNKDNAQENKKMAIEAMERVMRGEISDDEEFAEAVDLIGSVLNEEYQEREQSTKVKFPHIKGLQAAKEFEEFVKNHFEDVKHFHKTYDKLGDEVSYDVILPRIMLENIFEDGIVQKFIEILKHSTGIDIGIEQERQEFLGCIYLDVGFPAIMRAK